MNKKRLIGVLLSVMIAVTFSVFVITPLCTSSNYSATNPYAFALGASQANAANIQVNATNVVGQQGPFSLTINFGTYYIQESGDLMLFVVLASTPSGIVPGIALGNGTTGWHFIPQDYWMPSISLSGLTGNVTLFIYGGLLKNVWPSGWRTVDECFGATGIWNPLNNNTANRTNLFTATEDMHMLVFFSTAAS
jgi:hypothetical protein